MEDVQPSSQTESGSNVANQIDKENISTIANGVVSEVEARKSEVLSKTTSVNAIEPTTVIGESPSKVPEVIVIDADSDVKDPTDVSMPPVESPKTPVSEQVIFLLFNRAFFV